jgi:sulfite reductase alpha subunit-like flavoprotein
MNEHKNSYHTGSNLGIFIENSGETVDYLIQLVQLKREDKITVEQEGNGRVLKWPFPPGSTVDTICRQYVDV